MQLTSTRRTGRPPKRAADGTDTMLTIRVPAATKNLMIDMADAYDLSLAEYLRLLVERDASGHA